MQPDFSNAPEVREASELVNGIVTLTTDYKIATAEQYAQGGEQLKQVKGAQKRLEALRTSITGPINAALKAANDLFRQPAARLEDAERTIKRELSRYADEQERIRIEEQRKVDEAARKERERIEAQARKAAEAGKVEKADALEQRAATVVAPVIQREPPKVAGVSVRKVWKFEITDPSKINPTFLMPDETKIRKQVLALGADAAAIVGPGVRIYQENQYASGAA